MLLFPRPQNGTVTPADPHATRLTSATLVDNGSIELRGVIRVGLAIAVVAAAATPAIRLRPVELEQPSSTPSRITVGLVVTRPTWAASTRPVTLVEPETLGGQVRLGPPVRPWVTRVRRPQALDDSLPTPGRIQTGFVATAVAADPTPANVVRPVTLVEQAPLTGRIAVGLVVVRPPWAASYRPVALAEAESTRAALRVGIPARPGAAPRLRPCTLVDVDEMRGRIATGLSIAVEAQPFAWTVRPASLADAETVAGRITIGFQVATAEAQPFAFTVRPAALEVIDAPPGRIYAIVFVPAPADPVAPGSSGGKGPERPGQGRYQSKPLLADPDKYIRRNYEDQDAAAAAQLAALAAAEQIAVELAELRAAPVAFTQPAPLTALPCTDDELILLLM